MKILIKISIILLLVILLSFVILKNYRNITGLVPQKIKDNLILSTEHGPQGGDEINKIIRGKNYGWPIASYGKFDNNFSSVIFSEKIFIDRKIRDLKFHKKKNIFGIEY